MKSFTISPKSLSLQQVSDIIRTNASISLSPESKKLITDCRNYLDKKLKNSKEPIYGINTGFGALYNKSIPEKDLEKLQENLVRSHACGAGEEVPREIVRMMMLLKIHALAKGYSGIQLSTVEQLVQLYNKNIIPVVYKQGSLGASGDLAPLAHMSLALMGEGEVSLVVRPSSRLGMTVEGKGGKIKASVALKNAGLKPVKFRSKEALALLNGTQFMSAYGVWNIIQSQRLLYNANKIGALSLDAFDGRIDPFSALIQDVRPHKGQSVVAAFIRKLLEGSSLIKRKKTHIQDPYSFRCIPQVHGASYDVIEYVSAVFTTEINSVTDNPTIFPKEDKIISGGNFHGQPLAIALDMLAIAVAELGSISERRTYLLISGQRGLPPFLVKEAGLNSGTMITQYTAASIASENKQLCTPASVDTIMSSNGQEDHVSMGANAATKCFRVIENTKTILAIELLNAARALEFRRPAKSSSAIEKMHAAYRKKVPFLKKDEVMQPLINESISFMSRS